MGTLVAPPVGKECFIGNKFHSKKIKKRNRPFGLGWVITTGPGTGGGVPGTGGGVPGMGGDDNKPCWTDGPPLCCAEVGTEISGAGDAEKAPANDETVRNK